MTFISPLNLLYFSSCSPTHISLGCICLFIPLSFAPFRHSHSHSRVTTQCLEPLLNNKYWTINSHSVSMKLRILTVNSLQRNQERRPIQNIGETLDCKINWFGFECLTWVGGIFLQEISLICRDFDKCQVSRVTLPQTKLYNGYFLINKIWKIPNPPTTTVTDRHQSIRHRRWWGRCRLSSFLFWSSTSSSPSAPPMRILKSSLGKCSSSPIRWRRRLTSMIWLETRSSQTALVHSDSSLSTVLSVPSDSFHMTTTTTFPPFPTRFTSNGLPLPPLLSTIPSRTSESLNSSKINWRISLWSWPDRCSELVVEL